jgi:hypothetical protein
MRRLPLLFACVLLVACAGERPIVTPEEPSADEYAVWAAAVDARFGSTHPRFVVEEETYSLLTGGPIGPASLRADSSVPRALVDDYAARNARPARVRMGLLHPRSVGLLPDLRGPLGAAAELASDGRLTLSRVGFDRGGRRAIVTIAYTCGGLCGRGATLVMERDDHGHWKETSSVGEIYF